MSAVGGVGGVVGRAKAAAAAAFSFSISHDALLAALDAPRSVPERLRLGSVDLNACFLRWEKPVFFSSAPLIIRGHHFARVFFSSRSLDSPPPCPSINSEKNNLK